MKPAIQHRRDATVGTGYKSSKRRVRKQKKVEESPRVYSRSEKKELKTWGNVIKGYINEKDLEFTLADITMDLLQKPELPENPYVYMSNRMRRNEHRFSLGIDFVELSQGNDEIDLSGNRNQSRRELPVTSLEPADPLTGVTRAVSSNKFWGWPHVLKVVNIRALSDLWSKLESSNFMIYNSDKEDQGYRIRVISSLCGPIILFGGVLPFFPTTAHVNHDFLVEGPNFEKAVKKFAMRIMKDVFTLGQSDLAVVSAVFIETPVRGQGKTGASKKHGKKDVELREWSVEKIKSAKSSFISAVKLAVVAKRRIFADVLARISRSELAETAPLSKGNRGDEPGADTKGKRRFSIDSSVSYDSYDSVLLLDGEYVQFSKHFLFHFRLREERAEDEVEGAIVTDKKQNQVRFFGEYQACSLAYGVFGSKQDAAEYASLFRTPNGSYLRPQSEQLFGYKNFLKLCVSRAYELGELFQTSVELCGMCMWDENYKILADLRRLFTSQAGALRAQIHVIRAIQRVVMIVQTSNRSKDYQSVHLDAVQYQFQVFMDEVKRAYSVQDSCEVIALRGLVEFILESVQDAFGRMKTNAEAIHSLKFLENVCLVTEVTVARDIVSLLCTPEDEEEEPRPFSTTIRKQTIMGLAEKLVMDVVSKQKQEREAQQQESGKKSPSSTERFWSWAGIGNGNDSNEASKQSPNEAQGDGAARKMGTIKDAVEQRKVRSRDSESKALVMNLATETKRGIRKMRFPAQLAPEATLLQYIADTRIDKVVHDALFQVLTRRTLAPNPIPIINAYLRAQCARLPLWAEDDEELAGRFGPKARLKVAHQSTFVYGIATGNNRNLNLNEADPLRSRGVFGSRAAVQLAHQPSMVTLLAFAEANLRNSQPMPPGHATFSATVHLGVGGDALLFSQVDRRGTAPTTIESTCSFSLLENYVIEGPRLNGAIALFAHATVEHALHFYDKTPHLMLGLKTGKEALSVLNADELGGNEGGWRKHVPKKKTAGLRGEHTTSEEAPRNDVSAIREECVPISHSKGKSFDGILLKRDKSTCIREVTRAVTAHEPVVLLLAAQFPLPSDASKLGESVKPKYAIVVKHLGMHFKEVPSGRITSTFPNYCQFDGVYRYVWPTLGQAIQGVSSINSASDTHRGMRNTVDPDDSNSPVFQNYQQILQLRIARSCSRGDWFAAYKSLLWLEVLQNQCRLVNTPSDTKKLNARIADIVRGLKRNSIPRQLYQGQVVIASLRRILLVRHELEDFRGKVNKKLLRDLMERCRNLVESIVARPDCVYLPGLGITVDTVTLTISSLLEKDKSCRETEHVRLLGELSMYLECLKVSSSLSIHQSSAPVQNALWKYTM